MQISDRCGRYEGFSLIELLAVVVMIAILAAIAVPTYQSAIHKSRRTEGKTLLQVIMASEERYYSRTNRYTDALADLGFEGPVDSEPGRHYALAQISVGDERQRVAITVTPRGAQSDDACANLTLDSLGRRSASGQAPNAGDCW